MKKMTCEMCNSIDIVKEDDFYVCQSCGTKYTIEAAKKLMIDGTVDVKGTVKVDNTAFVEKYLTNARRAYSKEDWEEVERYYNMVEQNVPNNMEAVFFSAFGKAMLSLTDSEYYKREQKFKVLNNSISVINDYFEVTNEDKEAVLRSIAAAIHKMWSVNYVFNANAGATAVGSKYWQVNLFDATKKAFITELDQIAEKHNDPYIQEIKSSFPVTKQGCYVATCVYGSYDCPQVWTLRRYRDDTLARSWYGRAFIKVYYIVSPSLVKCFGNTKWFKKMWRGRLDRMVNELNNKGVKDTPYNDPEY